MFKMHINIDDKYTNMTNFEVRLEKIYERVVIY